MQQAQPAPSGGCLIHGHPALRKRTSPHKDICVFSFLSFLFPTDLSTPPARVFVLSQISISFPQRVRGLGLFRFGLLGKMCKKLHFFPRPIGASRENLSDKIVTIGFLFFSSRLPDRTKGSRKSDRRSENIARCTEHVCKYHVKNWDKTDLIDRYGHSIKYLKIYEKAGEARALLPNARALFPFGYLPFPFPLFPPILPADIRSLSILFRRRTDIKNKRIMVGATTPKKGLRG